MKPDNLLGKFGPSELVEANIIQEAALPAVIGLENSFCDRVASLLANIDCKPARSGNQREEIFRLRCAAGVRAEAVAPPSSLSFWDRYDYAGNVHLLGLYIDDELASSVRLHIAAGSQQLLPSLGLFADMLQPKLDDGQVIIDCTRFVVDEHLCRVYRELPYATLQFCMLAAEHFNAKYLITTASPAHEAFYRRAFSYKAASAPRRHPDLASSVRLMTLHYPTAADSLRRRYPFFRSTAAERQRLFGRREYY